MYMLFGHRGDSDNSAAYSLLGGYIDHFTMNDAIHEIKEFNMSLDEDSAWDFNSDIWKSRWKNRITDVMVLNVTGEVTSINTDIS